MIKVQDFAHSKGVTPNAIYKHIRNHKDELEEHIVKQGKNGTWLDDYACDYINKLMINNPIIVGDSQQQAEIERLKIENDQLKNKLIGLQEKMLDMSDQLQLAASAQLLLEDRNKQLDELKAENERLKNRSWWERLFK